MAETEHSARDRVLHALSDSTRRKLLKGIAEGRASVSEISEAVEMSGPAVSKHLHVLEDCGLIERKRNGRFHSFNLHPAAIEEAIETLKTILQISPTETENPQTVSEEVDVHLL